MRSSATEAAGHATHAVGPAAGGAPGRAAGVRSLCEAFQATAVAFGGEVALRTSDGCVELTWDQYRARVESVARGMAALGVQRGETIAMLLRNRPEFHVLDLAALHLGVTPFSIYGTSAPAQIAEVCANAQPRLIVTEPGFLDRVREARGLLATRPEVVVIDGEAPGALTLAEVEAARAAEFPFEQCWRRVGGEDIATLIYTSGTTGAPKGVMITHRNLLAAWDSSVAAAPVLARRGRYVSYLPTAHLADRVFSHYPALRNGSTITCVEDPRAAVAQLPGIRPSVWMAVPRIWEKLKDAIEAGAFGVLDEGLRQRLGLDAAELLVSGAAPIREDVLGFFARLGIEICEGYGMTESTAIATLNRPGATRAGTVGPPMPGVEVALAEDGEVLLRGPAVMAGYRGQPKQTAEAIDRDGWLHTGDIGGLDEDGYLRIVDRKKELIINAAGKNMSPQNIEAKLKAASSLIGHAVAIGDRRPYNTALLVLDPDMLAFHGLSAEGAEVHEQLLAAVEHANGELSRVEQVKRFTLVDGTWQPGGELVTPTLKLKRRPIAERYAAEIEAMYNRGRQEQG
ncbi:MAG: AMP-dependent synthetase/ligase [Solirubrobacteraceae bacterium]